MHGSSDIDNKWMNYALRLAEHAQSINEVPIGAVIIKDNSVIGEGWNTPISACDPSAHAEINAIRDASKKIGNYRIEDSVMYVTFEPCIMCLGAIQQARIKQVVFGALDHSQKERLKMLDKINYNIDKSIIYKNELLSEACSNILSNFFKEKR